MTRNSQHIFNSDFFWRRLHSLSGLMLVLFLLEHLLTNSQAALWFGEDGKGFIHGANFIHGLPYLQAIEIAFVASPILVHVVWGIKYLMTAEPNSWKGAGNRPSLPEYSKNRAYTWQRITSWLILFALVFHVVQMRFMNVPTSAKLASSEYFMVGLELDEGLYTLSERLGVELFDGAWIEKELSLQDIESDTKSVYPDVNDALEQLKQPLIPLPGTSYSLKRSEYLKNAQHVRENESFMELMSSYPIDEGRVVAVAGDFGTALLLAVRETMKAPIMLFIYSIFVIATCFHAANGLWTFLITWGICISDRSQDLAKKASKGLMYFLVFLGLSAVWGTYWINLRF